MTEAQFDDLGDAGLGERGDQVADLAVGVVGGGVKERGGQFDFEGFSALDEVDYGGVGDGDLGEESGGGLGEIGLGLDGILIGFGVLDQGGGGADFAGEEVGGFGGEAFLRG